MNRMTELKRILIGGKLFPIKFDINVLEHVQDEYGTVNEFERNLRGIEAVRDAEGNVIYDEKEKPVLLATKEPSVRAIKTALPAMINEGLAIEAEETGRSWEPVSELWVLSNCNISFETLSDMIYEEYKRCFEVKK